MLLLPPTSSREKSKPNARQADKVLYSGAFTNGSNLLALFCPARNSLHAKMQCVINRGKYVSMIGADTIGAQRSIAPRDLEI